MSEKCIIFSLPDASLSSLFCGHSPAIAIQYAKSLDIVFIFSLGWNSGGNGEISVLRYEPNGEPLCGNKRFVGSVTICGYQ